MKALAGVQRTLQTKYAHLGIPKHPTDCRKQLALACICSRKSPDKAVVVSAYLIFATVLLSIAHGLLHLLELIALPTCHDLLRSTELTTVLV
jgi:hypothetical protein